ncbi:hypothetical protein FJZ41_03430 [Candidatus Shapirobacteria bacterium]|nr:hypothetical protein [Candidatus Shapirobacteria bacterium]
MTSITGSQNKKRGVTDSALEKIREWELRAEKQQKEELAQRYERLQTIHQQDRLIFSQKEQAKDNQIKNIQEELKKLASSIENLDQEVQKAVAQTPVETGVYHVTFFEKLKNLILLLRKQVEDSTSWLAVFNQRAKKRNPYYWAQVGKSGTKFMLSPDRNVATSVG